MQTYTVTLYFLKLFVVLKFKNIFCLNFDYEIIFLLDKLNLVSLFLKTSISSRAM